MIHAHAYFWSIYCFVFTGNVSPTLHTSYYRLLVLLCVVSQFRFLLLSTIFFTWNVNLVVDTSYSIRNELYMMIVNGMIRNEKFMALKYRTFTVEHGHVEFSKYDIQDVMQHAASLFHTQFLGNFLAFIELFTFYWTNGSNRLRNYHTFTKTTKYVHSFMVAIDSFEFTPHILYIYIYAFPSNVKYTNSFDVAARSDCIFLVAHS